MAELREMKMVKQVVRQLESGNKLAGHMTEGVLSGTVRKGCCAMKFKDRLVKELKPENAGHAMSVLQRFGKRCS